MRVALSVSALEARRLVRRRWFLWALAAGPVAAVLIALSALGEQGLAREDDLRQGAATLLLLGGLAVAAALGAAALNTDSDSGHFGALLGNGASRVGLVAGALLARVAGLVAVLVVWGLSAQGASVAVSLGGDADLALHTALMGIALLLTLTAAAAGSSVVNPAVSAIFGVSVFITAQAMVNLKAAADQDIIGTAGAGINGAYLISPRIPTSPLMEELQVRDATGPAVPRVDINGNEVLLQATGWQTAVWALGWCALLGLLAYLGMRRRPIA
ncbi:MAG: hypothetical protein RIB67_00695 [Miltoncostaeaceae bacterium]